MDQDTGHSVGSLLRDARVSKGIDLKTLSNELCIRSGLLTALELDHFDEFPARIYAVGFIRSYAGAVGLDADDMIKRFQVEYPEPKPDYDVQNAAAVAIPIWERVPGLAKMASAGAGLSAAAVAIIWGMAVPVATGSLTADDQTPAPAARENLRIPVTAPQKNTVKNTVKDAVKPEVPDVAGETPRSEIALSAGPVSQAGVFNVDGLLVAVGLRARAESPDEIAAVANNSAFTRAVLGEKTGRVMLQAATDSWIEITDGDTVIFSGVLRQGDGYRPPTGAGLRLKTSNAGGLEVYVDGKRAPGLGSLNSIIEDIRIEPERLISGNAVALL